MAAHTLAEARTFRSLRSFVLAALGATVAADQVAVVAVFAIVLLHGTVAAARAEAAARRALAVAALVLSVVTRLARRRVHLTVAAVRAEDTTWRTTRVPIGRIGGDVQAVVAGLVAFVALAITAVARALAVGRARAVAAIV